MGFIANFKAKRVAKRAKAAYELELYEWNRENEVLNQALEIFQDASSGDEPDDATWKISKAWFRTSFSLFHS